MKPVTSIWARCVLLALLLFHASPTQGGPPNFILFYADDLGWADTSTRMMKEEPLSNLTPSCSDSSLEPLPPATSSTVQWGAAPTNGTSLRSVGQTCGMTRQEAGMATGSGRARTQAEKC
jgi:hypothetical protein